VHLARSQATSSIRGWQKCRGHRIQGPGHGQVHGTVSSLQSLIHSQGLRLPSPAFDFPRLDRHNDTFPSGPGLSSRKQSTVAAGSRESRWNLVKHLGTSALKKSFEYTLTHGDGIKGTRPNKDRRRYRAGCKVTRCAGAAAFSRKPGIRQVEPLLYSSW